MYAPFYNIYSKALHILLGVEDMRSVKERLKNIGVRVYGQGKDAYIITEEFIELIKTSDKQITTYKGRSKYSI